MENAYFGHVQKYIDGLCASDGRLKQVIADFEFELKRNEELRETNARLNKDVEKLRFEVMLIKQASAGLTNQATGQAHCEKALHSMYGNVLELGHLLSHDKFKNVVRFEMMTLEKDVEEKMELYDEMQQAEDKRNVELENRQIVQEVRKAQRDLQEALNEQERLELQLDQQKYIWELKIERATERRNERIVSLVALSKEIKELREQLNSSSVRETEPIVEMDPPRPYKPVELLSAMDFLQKYTEKQLAGTSESSTTEKNNKEDKDKSRITKNVHFDPNPVIVHIPNNEMETGTEMETETETGSETENETGSETEKETGSSLDEEQPISINNNNNVNNNSNTNNNSNKKSLVNVLSEKPEIQSVEILPDPSLFPFPTANQTNLSRYAPLMRLREVADFECENQDRNNQKDPQPSGPPKNITPNMDLECTKDNKNTRKCVPPSVPPKDKFLNMDRKVPPPNAPPKNKTVNMSFECNKENKNAEKCVPPSVPPKDKSLNMDRKVSPPTALPKKNPLNSKENKKARKCVPPSVPPKDKPLNMDFTCNKENKNTQKSVPPSVPPNDKSQNMDMDTECKNQNKNNWKVPEPTAPPIDQILDMSMEMSSDCGDNFSETMQMGQPTLDFFLNFSDDNDDQSQNNSYFL